MQIIILILSLITAFITGVIVGEGEDRIRFISAQWEEEEDMIDFVEAIGEAAVLENLAEECTELAQAALKVARIVRGENPTPMDIRDARNQLKEEKQDVLNLIYVHGNESFNYNKLSRWEDRLEGKA